MSATAASSNEAFWIAGTPSTTLEQAIQDAPNWTAERALYEATVQAMLANATAGKTVPLPGQPDLTPQQTVTELQGVLSFLQSPSSPPPSGPDVARGATAPDEAQTIDPNGFPINGYSCYGNSTWCGMAYVVNVNLCLPDGWAITDTIRATVTVNPGAKTSMFSWTATYLPNDGNFANVHFEAWALCYGNSNCNHDNSPNLFPPPTNRYWYLSSIPAMNGDYLAHGIRLWAYCTPCGSWARADGKTGTAACNVTDNVCTY